MLEIMSRKEARKRGLKIYLSKKICKRGHLERYASGGCVNCSNEVRRVKRLEPAVREVEARKKREWRKKHAGIPRKRKRNIAARRRDNQKRRLRQVAAVRALRELGIKF